MGHLIEELARRIWLRTCARNHARKQFAPMPGINGIRLSGVIAAVEFTTADFRAG